MLYFITIIIFLFVWTFLSGLLVRIFCGNKPIDKLKYYNENYELKQKYEKDKDTPGPLRFLASLVPRSRLEGKKAQRIELELVRADIPITVEELFVIKILSSAAVSFLGFAVFKSFIIVIIVFFLLWNLPKVIISSRKHTRIKEFDSQLNEGITVISNSLKAGYSFLQAVAVVAEETKDPFSKEFKKLLKEMSLGISEEDALRNLLLRMESEDLRLIINAILIQKDIGGNLSEILDIISETIRERQKIKNELKTLTAQGRLSGIIVMLIPVFLGMVIFLFNREYMLLLFTTSTGLIMIITCVISELFGFILIRKIVNIDM